MSCRWPRRSPTSPRSTTSSATSRPPSRTTSARLRILQAKSTLADKQQIRPLHGLGVSFLGANDPESAVVALKRAADLSRNTDGLFNINQVEFIDALIDAYAGHRPLRRKRKRKACTPCASRKPRTAAARSSCSTGSTSSRAGTRTIAATPASAMSTIARSPSCRRARRENDLRRVGPLRGIARSFRLETVLRRRRRRHRRHLQHRQPRRAGVRRRHAAAARRDHAGDGACRSSTPTRPSTSKCAARCSPISATGTWSTNALRRAYDTYADAWKSFAQVDNTKYLEAPRVLAYRPSISSIDRSQLDPAEAVLKSVELHFTVDRDGRIDNVTSPTTDVPDAIVRNSVTSMKRSRYAPRIENGAAVPTENVVFVERVLVKATSPDSPAPPSGKEAEKAPEAPPATAGSRRRSRSRPPEKK